MKNTAAIRRAFHKDGTRLHEFALMNLPTIPGFTSKVFYEGVDYGSAAHSSHGLYEYKPFDWAPYCDCHKVSR